MRTASMERIGAEYAASFRRLTVGYAETSGDRDDLFQEILVAIWNALPRFRGDASERTWVYRIAHNTAISASIRRQRRREDPLDFGLAQAHGDTPESLFAEGEQRRLLSTAIRALEDMDKQVVLLYLADVVGLSKGAVGARLTRLRSRLTETIAGKAGAR
jgi:RNA polymerase sigma factor (sigma-70 family)